MREVYTWEENLNYQSMDNHGLMESLKGKEDELIKAKMEIEKMFHIKDRYYKLLKVIDINEEVRKLLEDE